MTTFPELLTFWKFLTRKCALIFLQKQFRLLEFFEEAYLMPSQSTTPRLDFSQVPDVVLYDLCALACGKAKGGKNQKSK